MVVLFNLTIKTIRGEEFTIQTDRDADTLGLKVQIWELRNIGVDSQRLVFAGRELADAVKLVDAGVGDGATIFMVEAAAQNAVAPPAFVQPAPQNPAVVSSVPLIQQDADRVVVNLPPPQLNSGRRVVGYEPIDPSIMSDERKNATFDLARWIRKYTLFTAFLLVVGAAMCRHGGHMLIPILLTLIGWMGTRNLCRCYLGVYAAFVFVMSTFMVLGGIFGVRYAAHAHKHHPVWAFVLLIFVGILHYCIFACIVKLMSNVGKLVNDEKKEVRDRIASHRTLC